MLDGIIMEKQGIPAAVVCTEPFIKSCQAMIVAHGLADYPFVTIPHPIQATEKTLLYHWVNDCTERVADFIRREK